MDRRSFIGMSIAAGGATKLPASAWNGSSTFFESSFRTLGSGKHSLKVRSLGLGCMGMSFNRTFIPERAPMIRLIRKAYDLGVNFFDTAEVYGPWTNEELVGEAIAPFRKKIILCTKFGFNIVNGKPAGLNSRPEQIRKVVDASLGRLKTDYIDLLYQHRVDPNVPLEDVAGTVKDLIQKGKVRNFGLSEAGAADIRKAHAVQPLTAVQNEYSLMTREPEKEVLGVCEQLGIGFVPWSPIGRAYLTGYINERSRFDPANDNRPSLPRYQPANIIANWKLIDVLTEYGNQHGYTAAQVALAWLLAQKPYIVPIPGTTKMAHMMENLAAADISFSPDQLRELTGKFNTITVAGDRNPLPAR